MLRTLREPPEKGSPQEWVLRTVILRLEEVEHLKLRALAQIMLNKEKGNDAWKEYVDAAFPYIENARKQQEAALVQRLQKEVTRGVLGIKPLWQQTKRSAAVSRIRAKYDNVARTDEDRRLYKKMGTIIPR